MASESLESVFLEVLREHPVTNDAHNMSSTCFGNDCPDSRITKPWSWGNAHVAEQLAARFEQVGVRSKTGPTAELEPVFRVKEQRDD